MRTLATKRPTRRRLRFCVALAIAVSIGAMFLTPLPGRLLQDSLLAFLEQRFGVTASVGRLDVDLLRLRLTAAGLEVAARGHVGEPFLTVDRAVVDLAWSSVWRGASVDGLFLGGASVSVLRRADGRSNLPGALLGVDASVRSRRPEPGPAARGGSESEPPFKLPIRWLDVRELTATWRDEGSGFVLHLPATTVRLGADRGPAPDRVPGRLRTRGVVRVSGRGITTSISGIDGEIAYDGTSLFLDPLDLQAAGAELALRGRVDALFGRPRLALDYEATLDLPQLTSRLATLAAGSLSAAGSVRGPAADPEASVVVSGTGLRWGGTAVDRLDAALRLTSRAMTLDTLGLETAGGSLAASGALELAAGWPGEVEATWTGLRLDELVAGGAPALPPVPDAVVEGAASARWPALAPHAVELSARNRISSAAGSGNARLEAVGGRWRLTMDHAVGGAGRVTGVVEARMAASETAGPDDWRAARLTGRIKASCRQLHACVGRLSGPRDAGALFRGPATARLTVGGSLGRPEVTGVVESPAQAVGRERLHGLVARVEADPEAVRITVPGVALGRNEVAGSLRIRLADGALDGRVEGNLADLASLEPLLPAALAPSGQGTIEATVAGRPGRLRVDAVVGFDAVEIGGRRLGSGTGRAELDPTGLLRASLAVPELGARLDAEYRRSGAGAFAIRARVDEAHLDRLAPRALPLAGRVTGEASAAGDLADLASTRVEVRVAEAAGTFGSVPVGVVRPAIVVYDARGLRVSDLQVALGGTRLEIDGGLSRHGGAAAMTAHLRGDAADVADLLAAAGGPGAALGAVAAAGDLSLALTAAGTLDAVELTGWAEVDDGSIAVGDHPPVTGLSARASVREGMVRLDELRAAWGEGMVRGWAELPLAHAGARLPAAIAGRLSARDAPAVVHASIDGLTPAGLTAYVPPTVLENASGRLSASLDLAVPRSGVGESRGRLILTEAAFEVSGIAVAQRRPTVVDVAGGTATLAAFDWGNESNRLAMGGSLALRDGFRTDGWLEGDLDLRQVAAVTPALAAARVDAAGSARVRATLTGPLGSTMVRGSVEVADAELRIATPPLVLTDLDGAFSLDGDTLTVDRLRGGANGGRLEIGGGWTLGADPEGKHLTLRGTGVALDYPGGLRTETDVALAVRQDEAGPVLVGAIDIIRGAYREPITLAGGLLEALGQGTSAALPAPDAGSAGGMRLDVRLATREELVVDNNYVEAAVGGDLRVSGTTPAPVLTGRVTVREGGRVRLGNHTYEIDTGTLDFAGSEVAAAELELRARTRAGGYDVTLELQGSRGELTTNLQSEPPLPEADIVSVLLTGRRTGPADALLAVARDQVLGLASADLLAQAGRGVGLDLRIGPAAPDAGAQIRFDPSLVSTDLNPASRLTVGRDLRDDVRLVFSRSLREDDLVWFLDYLPRRDVELRMLFDDDRARTYEFRHAITAGAGLDRVASPDTPAPRVSEVVVRGDPGTDTAALRDLVSLRVGDRFDFDRQQRDRDRLLAELRGRGFLEARVRTRRAPGDDAGAVDLAYEVVRGPATELTVSGYRLPGTVRRDLEAIWARAVFDAFLAEEIEARVVAHLADAGYLRAAVQVRIAVEPGAGVTRPRDAPVEVSRIVKRVVVRIDPGQRTGERRLTFEGASAEDQSGLRGMVRARELDRAAWTDPESLADAVVSWYRDRGHLRAAASVGEPRFAGALAELPVHVASGPSFRVGSIEVAGTSARPAAEVRAAAELEEGAAYTERAVAAARARIRAFYRRAGHAAVDVALRQGIDDVTATVDVRFDVSEGPRQVVQAVVVEGAARTHPALVRAALDIEPGATVDPEAWSRARTRLYDTGVFRRVDIEATQAEAADVDVGGGAVPVTARVRLEEWPPYELRYGLRVIDDAAALGEVTGRALRLGAVGDLSRRNLLGRGLTGGLSARADREQQAVRAFLTLPTPHGRRTATNLFVSRRRESARSTLVGPVDVTTVTAERRLRPGAGTMLAVSANLDFGRSAAAPLDAGPLSADRWKLARIDGSAVVDTRDDLFDATRGFYHSSNVEYGAELGGPRTFFKYLGQQFAYRRLGGVVLASAARVGLATGLPRWLASERFFAGGGNTVRGYAQDSLGPFGVAEGGNALVVLNQEIRVPVGAGLSGVGFVDLGNVFASTRNILLRRLRTAVGLGLRLESPVGLVRLDYGLPVGNRPDGPRGRFFASLGQAF